MLAPIFNSIATLLSRLSATRAGYLDNLNQFAGSYFTSSRGAKLDNLDAAITTRSSHSAADVWEAATRTLTSSVIKSIQTGKVDTSTVSSGSTDELRYIDVSITSVTTSKAVVLHQVVFGADPDSVSAALSDAREGVGASGAVMARAYLTSSTNLRIYSGKSGTYQAFSGRWWVVEFN